MRIVNVSPDGNVDRLDRALWMTHPFDIAWEVNIFTYPVLLGVFGRQFADAAINRGFGRQFADAAINTGFGRRFARASGQAGFGQRFSRAPRTGNGEA